MYLDNDIDFSGEPLRTFSVSKNTPTVDFAGTFDGLGHTIRNFDMNISSLSYIGLISDSQGMAIRNLVLDSTCSLKGTNLNGINGLGIGGFVGKCTADKNDCRLENVVNMMEIQMPIGASGNLVGGIVGSCKASSFGCIVRNCLNFGSVNQINGVE